MLSLNLPEGVISELLYADDLVLMSETFVGLKNKFLEWKEAFESKVLKVNIGKSKVMVSDSIKKDGMPKSKVDLCWVCCLRVKANSVLCCMLVHGGYAGVKRLTLKCSIKFVSRKCEGNIGEAVEQEGRLHDEVETVWEFTYLGDRVSTSGGCETAVTVRTRCGWVAFRKCGELLYGRTFPLRLKGAVSKSYVRPAILYASEAWRLIESDMGIL